MLYDNILDIHSDPVFQELLLENPETPRESVATITRFLKVAVILNSQRELLFSEFGLTSGRFQLLMLLKRETNLALSPSELAKRTGVTRGTMTQFIDAIEKDGLVKRIDDPKDKRGMLVELTSLGVGRIKEILPALLKHIEQLTSVLNNEEQQAMLKLLEKIMAGSLKLASKSSK